MIHAFTIAALSVCPTGWWLRRTRAAPRIIVVVLACALAGELLMRATAGGGDAAWIPLAVEG